MRILSFFLNHLELKQLKRSHVPIVPSKTIPDSRPKCAKSTPVFRPKRHINHTLWGRGGEHAFLAYAGRGVPPTGYHDQYRGHSRKRTPPSRQSKKESVTGAGRLRECKYAEFLWQLRKTGFVKVAVSRAALIRLRETVRWESFHRGTQREHSSKPLKHRIVKRIFVFKRQIQAYFYPLKIFHLFGFPS